MMAITNALRAFCAVFGLFLVVSPVAAAPVTLAFEAEVEQVNRDPNPLALPFEVIAGDVVRGTFTFEPLDVASDVAQTETNQPFTAEFVIDGFSFANTEYTARAEDDLIGIVDDDGSGIRGPLDEIRLTRSLGGNLGDPIHLEWGFAFAFFGDENVLDGADLPADVAIWQNFEAGSLRLTFADQARTTSTIVRTSVDGIRQVPEPEGVALMIVLGIALFSHTTSTRRRS